MVEHWSRKPGVVGSIPTGGIFTQLTIAFFIIHQVAKQLEMRGIEPRAFHMQSERSTTELHPLYTAGLILYLIHYKGQNVDNTKNVDNPKKVTVPTGGLEPPIFGLGDRRLIH